MCIQVNKPERCFNLNVAHFSNLLINWLTNSFVNYTRTNQLRALTTCTLMCGLSWSRLTGLCIADEPVFEIFLHELHLDMSSLNISAQWRERCSWSNITEPTIRQPGFDPPRRSWSLLNHSNWQRRRCLAQPELCHVEPLSQRPATDHETRWTCAF